MHLRTCSYHKYERFRRMLPPLHLQDQLGSMAKSREVEGDWPSIGWRLQESGVLVLFFGNDQRGTEVHSDLAVLLVPALQDVGLTPERVGADFRASSRQR
mmetsp:Transcript_67803/g.136183  ORF Transcript_67803/g.136183 Transcript_67803/m.136183 type:complete len:100 (-) Transcript_67803:145-444(-)